MRTGLVFLFFLLFFNSICGQNNHHFKNLNRQDGLTNNFISTIHQDGFGYMWFGTKDGLNRYDGTIIDTYKSNSLNQNTLNSNVIKDILFTSTNKLLIGSRLGLNEFNYITEDFSKIEYLNSINISKIVEDKNKNIWIATENNLVLKFDENLNKIEGFSFADLIKKKFDVTSSNVKVLKYDDENFIVSILEKGFYLFNFISHEFKLKAPHNFTWKTRIRKILKIDDSVFWVATMKGIFIYNKNILVRHLKVGVSNKQLNNSYVHDMQKMNNDEIWIFTDGGGINVYNLKTKRFKYIKQNARNEFS